MKKKKQAKTRPSILCVTHQMIRKRRKDPVGPNVCCNDVKNAKCLRLKTFHSRLDTTDPFDKTSNYTL